MNQKTPTSRTEIVHKDNHKRAIETIKMFHAYYRKQGKIRKDFNNWGVHSPMF